MSCLNNPQVLFVAQRTIRTWQCSAIALMACGFLVERIVGDLKPLDIEQFQVTLKLVRSSA